MNVFQWKQNLLLGYMLHIMLSNMLGNVPCFVQLVLNMTLVTGTLQMEDGPGRIGQLEEGLG